MRKFVVSFLTVVAIFWSSSLAQAQTSPISQPDAEAFIGSLAERALSTLALEDVGLEERESQFRDILRDGFALRYISLLVLGNHRREATPEQLEEYQLYFAEFILKKYSALLGGYAGETFVVLGSRPSGKRDVLVDSEIQRDSGAPIPAEWRVRKFDDDLKVIDIKVEGVSMVKSQMDEFDAILNREGMTGLIAVLRARTGMLAAEAPA